MMANGSESPASINAFDEVDYRETNAKVVNINSTSRVIILRGHAKSVKHITFHPNGNFVTTSSADGGIYVFSISSEEASLIKKLDGIIPAVDVESETSSKVVWHPDGTTFAAPTPSKGISFIIPVNVDIQLVSMEGWEKQVVFKNGHTGSITDIEWSPNGAYLATAGADGKVNIWQTKDQTILTSYNPHIFKKLIFRYTAFNVIALAWHPTSNTLSFTTSQGQLYRWKECISSSIPSYGPIKKAPTRASNLDSSQSSRSPSILSRPSPAPFGDDTSEDDDFIVDDDGAGYVRSENRKRNAEFDDFGVSKRGKSDHVFQIRSHQPFQSGSTAWKGSRRYLSKFPLK